MKKSDSLHYVVTLAVTIIILTIMVAYNFSSFYSNTSDDLLEIGESNLAKETEYLDAYLRKGMDVLQVTAITMEYMMKSGASAEKLEDFLLKESERYIEEIDANFTGIYGVFNGDYLDGAGWVPDADYVPQEREWYLAAAEAGGKPVIVSPYLDAQTHTIMISVSQMLYDKKSVISLDIVLEEIQNITLDITLDGKGYGFIVDESGMVVAHSMPEELGKNYFEDAQMKKLLERAAANDSKNSFRLTLDGEKCTIFTNTVMDSWNVFMVVSNTRLYHEIKHILAQNILVCVIAFAFIATFCTMAFYKLRLHVKVAEESRRNVEKMSVTLMRTLARTIDAKDRYTNGHSQRVAKYSLEIAKRMGKSEEEQKQIYTAALLHDVGKIHIPDSIINKNTKLDESEFSYIKLHPVSGYYILKDINENPMIVQGAKWHHERYDGKGYPNGLEGNNIPEAARIIGVADAYDAMTSNRSYRSILSQEKVRQEILDGRGTQFDPAIADIMLEMIDEDKDYQMKENNEAFKKILAVDDESVNLYHIQEAIENEAQYILYTERSGEKALDFLKENEVDLILLDLEMPGMNGFDVFYELRKNRNLNTPVVLMIGENGKNMIRRANSIGIEDFLIKPFMPQALLEVLHSILQDDIEL